MCTISVCACSVIPYMWPLQISAFNVLSTAYANPYIRWAVSQPVSSDSAIYSITVAGIASVFSGNAVRQLGDSSSVAAICAPGISHVAYASRGMYAKYE